MKRFIVLMTVFMLTMMFAASSAMAGGGKSLWKVFIFNNSPCIVSAVDIYNIGSDTRKNLIEISSGKSGIATLSGMDCPSFMEIWISDYWGAPCVAGSGGYLTVYLNGLGTKTACCWHSIITISNKSEVILESGPPWKSWVINDSAFGLDITLYGAGYAEKSLKAEPLKITKLDLGSNDCPTRIAIKSPVSSTTINLGCWNSVIRVTTDGTAALD